MWKKYTSFLCRRKFSISSWSVHMSNKYSMKRGKDWRFRVMLVLKVLVIIVWKLEFWSKELNNNEGIREGEWWERGGATWKAYGREGAVETWGWGIVKFRFRVFFYNGFRCWLNQFNRFKISETKTKLNWFFS